MSELKIKIITWNIGKSIKEIKSWNDELQKWTIINEDSDIIFITIQEASKEVGSKGFPNALKNKLKNYTIYFEGEGTIMPGQDFYVYGYLCVKNSLIKQIEIPPVPNNIPDKTIDAVCIRKKGACTKPTLGFGIKISGKKLVFICSHLPVDTTDKEYGSFGYNDRVQAMKTIQKEVIDDVSNSIGNNIDNIFWAGDLNFRVQIDESGKPTFEQLDQLVSKHEVLLNFKEHTKNNIKKTCRYLEYDGKSDYSQFVLNRQNGHSYDPKRTPSYCDRILYKGNFTPKQYYSWPPTPIINLDQYPKSIAFSDHEPVVLEGSIITGQSGGNDYYKFKYYKYKSKYLHLKN